MSALLSINSYYYSRDGSEVVFFNHNEIFQRLGWQVVPFAMHHPENRSSAWSKFFVEEIEFGHDYNVVEKLRRIPKIVYSLEAQRKLSELLDTIKVDIAHCHSIYHHLSPSILTILKSRDIPTVMTLHDLKIACPAYHMYNEHIGICDACKGGNLLNIVRNRCVKGSLPLSALIMMESSVNKWLGSYTKNVSRFISPCRFYIDILCEWGWDRQNFVHVPNCIDLEGYEPDFTPGHHFLYFGRLSAEKGLLTLIRAASRAGIELRFAGDGPQRELLEAESKKLNAQVIFLGHLSGERLRNEIRSSRATVLPSEWYENAPISILESFALGKPVIGANIGGIPELIQVTQVGVLFESGSLEDLGNALLSMEELSDEKIRKMGKAARNLVEEQYSCEKYLQRISRVYADLGCEIDVAKKWVFP